MTTKQAQYEARTRRALRILREIAKDFGYSVGGHGGTEIDQFMDGIEDGSIIVTRAYKVAGPNKGYWLKGDGRDEE